MNVPNPGSKEAGELGCICAVMDNHYGKGFYWPSIDNPEKDTLSFWITDGCPLHRPEGHTEEADSA